MANFSSGELAGIIIGSILGALFLLTCVLSAIKAVKDRKSIKERIREKKRAKAMALKLKREGKLGQDNSIISIEDPGYFTRNGTNTNNHRVVGHSNSCPTNGQSRDGKANKRNSEPVNTAMLQYDQSPYAGRRKVYFHPVTDDAMNVGVYRYTGEQTTGVENAAFEMKETVIRRENGVPFSS